MKRILLLCCSSFFLCSSVFAANLLTNPGFENYYEGWVTEGKNWWDQTDNIDTPARNVYLYNNVTFGAMEYWGALKQSFVVNRATQPRFYARIKCKTRIALAAPVKAGLMLVFKNAAGVELATKTGKYTISGDQDWRTIFVAANTPVGAVKVEFIAFVASPFSAGAAMNGAQVLFDDAELSSSLLSLHPTALVNGSFENGPSDWQEADYDLSGVAVVDLANVQSGKVSLRKVVNKGEVNTYNEYFGQMSQNIYFDAAGGIFPTGTFVNARGLVKPQFNPMKKTSAGIQLEFYNASDAVIGVISDMTGGTSGYRNLYISGNTPAGTKYVRLSGIVYASAEDAKAGGLVYFDTMDFSKARLSGYPVLQTTLINGGFENGLTDWTDSSGQATVSKAYVKGGIYSVRMQVKSPSCYNLLLQDIDIPAARKPIATASIFAKSGLKNAVGGFRLEFLNASGAVMSKYSQALVIDKSFDWKKLSLTNISIPTSAKKIRLVCTLWASSAKYAVGESVFLDNAAITFAP